VSVSLPVGNAVLGRHPPADPYPTYRRLLAIGPVVWSDYLHCWAVLGHSSAQQALRDDWLLTDDVFQRMVPRLAEATGHDFAALCRLRDCIAFFIDPPAHGRARRVLASLMARWPTARLRPIAEDCVEHQLQLGGRQGGFDLVRDFARRIPGSVVARMLGIPQQDVPELARASETFVRLFDVVFPLREYHRIDAAARVLVEYFAARIRERRVRSAEDGVSDMIRYADAHPGASDDALAGLCAFTFFACQETTASFLAGGGATLLQNPAAVAALREDPSRLARAAEDLLRHHSPVQAVGRVASADRSLGEVRVAAGDRVVVFLGAANRDPAVYPDGPCPALDRDAAPHLAFGDGRHFCLGAPLARMEGIAAFSGLVSRPGIRLDPDRAVWSDRRNFRGLVSCPVLL
jgi:pimeloyl-[acyl-carrier protein] synthase